MKESSNVFIAAPNGTVVSLPPDKIDSILPIPLKPSDIPPSEFDGKMDELLLRYPFCPEYIGLKNPYTGQIVQKKADYLEYLREHSYHEHCDAYVRSLKNKLAKSYAANKKLQEENDSLRVTIKAERKKRQSVNPHRSRRVFPLLLVFFLILFVCYVLAIVLPSCSSKSNSDDTARRHTASTSATSSSRSPTNTGTGSTRATAAPSETRYIGNKSSKKVHSPDCSYLPDEQNRIYFDDLDEAYILGYTDCQKCHPH